MVASRRRSSPDPEGPVRPVTPGDKRHSGRQAPHHDDERRTGRRAPHRPARPGRHHITRRSMAIMSAVTTLEEAVRAALATVDDPEIRRPITELGMVESVRIDAAGVTTVGLLLTVAG